MHDALIEIKSQLDLIITKIRTTVQSDEPFGNAHGNWSFPGLTKAELIEEAQTIIELINLYGKNDVGDQEALLNDYVRRLEHLQAHTIPQIWGNAGQAVSAYLFTLQGLRKALSPALNNDLHKENTAKLKKLTTQLRNMEARLKGLEPRADTLDMMLERIEKAYNTADQLPADLETLNEARMTISELTKNSKNDQSVVSKIRDEVEELQKEIDRNAENARSVLERCETAYSAATSVGLAAAFSERSEDLSGSIKFWIGGLIAALIAGGYFGSNNLSRLSDLFMSPNVSSSVIVFNLLLSIISVGAPVWFAWLATKQIGQRFRLAEDYAFKASISRAYEGFRREATRFDKDMEAKLLTSALTRLDELPLRLVETDSHGSPWHELVSSNEVKKAMKTVPDFAEQVRSLAKKRINAIIPTKAQMKEKSTQAQNQDEEEL